MTTEATKPQAESSATRAMPMIAMAAIVVAGAAILNLGTESAKRVEQQRIYQDQASRQNQNIGARSFCTWPAIETTRRSCPGVRETTRTLERRAASYGKASHRNHHQTAGLALKPLFIPLKREYFEAFKSGTKTEEYRPEGPRWNARTCAVGRPVVLSLGYGKANRLNGVVTGYRASKEPQPPRHGAIATATAGAGCVCAIKITGDSQ